MNHIKHIIRLAAALCCFCVAACYGPEKAHLREALNSTKLELQAEAAQMQLSKQKTQEAVNEERIDTVIDNRIQDRLKRYSFEIDSVNKEIAALEAQLANPKLFRKNYADSIKPKLEQLEASKKGNQLRLKRFTMLNEALDISRQNPFDLAAFFATGKYTIPKENYRQASELFMPAIDSLILFSNKYADVPRTSTLVVNGYADGQSIDTASELYKTVLHYLNKNEAGKKELNRGLSQLRALEISNLLDQLLKQKMDAFKEAGKIKFDFYGYGQGETYPSKKITNYQEDDERRRIVLVYWSVIPD